MGASIAILVIFMTKMGREKKRLAEKRLSMNSTDTRCYKTSDAETQSTYSNPETPSPTTTATTSSSDRSFMPETPSPTTTAATTTTTTTTTNGNRIFMSNESYVDVDNDGSPVNFQLTSNTGSDYKFSMPKAPKIYQDRSRSNYYKPQYYSTEQ